MNAVSVAFMNAVEKMESIHSSWGKIHSKNTESKFIGNVFSLVGEYRDICKKIGSTEASEAGDINFIHIKLNNAYYITNMVEVLAYAESFIGNLSPNDEKSNESTEKKLTDVVDLIKDSSEALNNILDQLKKETFSDIWLHREKALEHFFKIYSM